MVVHLAAADLAPVGQSVRCVFRRIKAGETPGYPRFRSATRFDSVDFRHGDGAKFTHLTPTRIEGKRKPEWWWADTGLGRTKNRGKREARLHLQGVGTLWVWMHRSIPDGAVLGQVSIKREGGLRRPRWFVVVPVETVTDPLPVTGAVVGLDLATGANGLAYTSDGARFDNPRHLHQAAEKLTAAQQALARKKRGSNRRRNQVEKVARLHAKVRRARLDHLHKQATALVTGHDVIAVENLRPAHMTRRATLVPDPETPGAFLPNGGAAKTGLNKSILDAGWGIFLQLLHAKAESDGRVVVAVDPRNTSRTCHACGHLDPQARDRKTYTCTREGCEWNGDADVNAARNILRAGLALLDAASHRHSKKPSPSGDGEVTVHPSCGIEHREPASFVGGVRQTDPTPPALLEGPV